MTLKEKGLIGLRFALWFADALDCWKKGLPTPELKLDMTHFKTHPYLKDIEQ